MENNQIPTNLRAMFLKVDEMDLNGFLGFLSKDVSFKFGNAETLKGKKMVGDVLDGFFKSIKNISHKLNKVWEMDQNIICNGKVTYTRHNDTTLTVPFANILTKENNLFSEYLIYVDVSQLYE